jgi:hypothetical protein
MRAPVRLLLQEVVHARDLLATARTRGDPELTRRARSILCDTLEAYTQALAERALPVPYAVRDELRLLQHVPW